MSFATVGGNQELEILGYEEKEKKVYILKHFYDGRGRLPQLYYYQLHSKKPQQLIEVKSLYIHPQTKKIDYDQEPYYFNQQLQQIKNRLKMLEAIPIHLFKLHILSRKTQVTDHPLHQYRIAYQYQYQIKALKQSSLITPALSYEPQLTLQQAFKIPKMNMSIVTVKYLAIPFESGYTQEDVLLLQAHP